MNSTRIHLIAALGAAFVLIAASAGGQGFFNLAPLMMDELRTSGALSRARGKVVHDDFTAPAREPVSVQSQSEDVFGLPPLRLDQDGTGVYSRPNPLLEGLRSKSRPADIDAPARELISVSAAAQLKESGEKHVLGARLHFVVSVTWEGSIGDVSIEDIEAPGLDGLRLAGRRLRDEISGDRVTREVIFDLEATKEGAASIGPATVRYTDRISGQEGVLKTSRVDLRIGPAPRDLRKPGAVVGMILAALVLAGLVIAIVAKAATKRDEVLVAPPTSLERLRDRDGELDALMIEGDDDRLFEAVGERVREFVALDEGDDARRLTSESIRELLASMESPREDAGQVRDLLERCDAVRFAAHRPTAEERGALVADWKALVTERMSK